MLPEKPIVCMSVYVCVPGSVTDVIKVSNHHHNHLNSHFPRKAGQASSAFSSSTCSRKELLQINDTSFLSAGYLSCHIIIVSEHWWKYEAVISTSDQTTSILHPPSYSWYGIVPLHTVGRGIKQCCNVSVCLSVCPMPYLNNSAF